MEKPLFLVLSDIDKLLNAPLDDNALESLRFARKVLSTIDYKMGYACPDTNDVLKFIASIEGV